MFIVERLLFSTVGSGSACLRLTGAGSSSWPGGATSSTQVNVQYCIFPSKGMYCKLLLFRDLEIKKQIMQFKTTVIEHTCTLQRNRKRTSMFLAPFWKNYRVMTSLLIYSPKEKSNWSYFSMLLFVYICFAGLMKVQVDSNP